MFYDVNIFGRVVTSSYSWDYKFQILEGARKDLEAISKELAARGLKFEFRMKNSYDLAVGEYVDKYYIKTAESLEDFSICPEEYGEIPEDSNQYNYGDYPMSCLENC